MSRGVAVVTGGAGGIGQAVLARLARDGFIPVSWDLSTDAPAARLALRTDVTDLASLTDAATQTIAEAGPIRALVINAGILGPVARAWEVDPRWPRSSAGCAAPIAASRPERCSTSPAGARPTRGSGRRGTETAFRLPHSDLRMPSISIP